MDFDEYDYLEKTVENADFSKVANGRDSRDASKKRNEEEDDYRQDARSKKVRVYEDDERAARKEEIYRERDSETPHSRSREADRERRRERSHSRSRDADPERGRERSHSRSRDIDLRRERERSHSRSRDIDLRRERERSHSRSRDVDPRRERSHSRSRDADVEKRRERSHSRTRDLEYNRDMEGDKERRESREREFRYPKEKKSKKEDSPAAEPEADPERDQRTVFAYQICLKADERDVYEFFSKAGKVRDVRLIMDRNSRRSKGVGYIEFYDAMSVPMAIAMSGQLLRGLPVMVKPSEAEKNLVQSTATAGIAGVYTSNPGIARRLYVGNLHFNITEDQLRQVFEPFGIVELVQLPTDPETGQCKGFGFVQYARLEDARTAQAALNGVLELAGRIIKVSSVTEQPGMQEMGVTPGELDDDDGGGLALTARSRALLMQKLDRTGTVSSITGSILPPVVSPPLGGLAPVVGSGILPVAGSALGQIGHPGVASMQNATLLATASGLAGVEPIGAPSDCLLLRNMFDPTTETEPDFDLDIRDEVQQECSKFGVVKHIFVDKNSAGHVYIRFDDLLSAAKAQQALHGRWFAGKMITTSFLTARAYETKFPESK